MLSEAKHLLYRSICSAELKSLKFNSCSMDTLARCFTTLSMAHFNSMHIHSTRQACVSSQLRILRILEQVLQSINLGLKLRYLLF